MFQLLIQNIKKFNLINTQKIDVIFNALGKFGEDGIAQSYFGIEIPHHSEYKFV